MLHLFTPHGKYRRDFRIIQGSLFSISACLVWLTAGTRRSNILALMEGNDMNIKTLHQIQVNEQASESYYLQQNVHRCVSV